MDDEVAAAFLDGNDHGVLSLGVDDRGYGFPISYTYDGETDRVVLGFVGAPGSKKRAFATGTDEATLTVFTHDDVDSWRSVVVEGPLRAIGEGDGSHSVPDIVFRRESGDDGGEIANLDQFDRTWYELRIESITGMSSGL
jgi:nitroimidazol reductase NimA-like FMN-containing flavoprotein (pyridoxamine 5'-phosphate oxidase superfamily)